MLFLFTFSRELLLQLRFIVDAILVLPLVKMVYGFSLPCQFGAIVDAIMDNLGSLPREPFQGREPAERSIPCWVRFWQLHLARASKILNEY